MSLLEVTVKSKGYQVNSFEEIESWPILRWANGQSFPLYSTNLHFYFPLHSRRTDIMDHVETAEPGGRVRLTV